ncbi:tyrosine-type recombinase/integrase [Terrimonas pollutisoli]|uniref:tyrosine-type recombinase/integrase n=1 Tax=Terrimonas pollutisoli TaxID=3034147 RepID=UPI0023EAB6D1|nr:site-specific integrase [Terrimonas sp. H1YJ31]
MKATVTFFPNTTKKSKKNGKVPMYMRISYKGLKTESRLNVELTQDEIRKWDPFTMRFSERNFPANHILNRLDQKFTDFLILNSTELSRYNPVDIKNFVIGVETKSSSIALLDFIDNYFKNEVAANINKTPGTVKTYRRAINHMHGFLSYRNQRSLTVQQLTFEIANDFKNYLTNSNPQLNRAGMTEVSAAGVIKKFRTMFTRAVDRGLLPSNHFKAVKIKTKSPRRERLTSFQISQLYNLTTQLLPHLHLYKDIFLFSVYTGLAYHDAMSLTQKDIEKRPDDSQKLLINRKKTGVITECFLPEEAIQIVNKYGAFADCIITGKLLPYRSNKEVNAQLKIIANCAGIKIPLSTHIARHSFRQLLSEAGITDYGVIKRLMGQTRSGDVDEVYYSITEKSLWLAKKKIDLHLKEFVCTPI